MNIKFYKFFTCLCLVSVVQLGSFAQAPTSECEDFPPLCDVDGFIYMGRNPPSTGIVATGFCGPGTQIDNPGFVNFIAPSANIIVRLTWSNCTGQMGLQWAIYENCNGVFDSPIANTCGASCGMATGSEDIQINSTPGQIYSLMVDGCAGSQCDFTLEVIQAGEPEVHEFPPGTSIIGETNLCAGATDLSCLTYSIEAVDLAFDYLWTLNGNSLDITNVPMVALSDLTAPGGVLCVQGINFCDSNMMSCITIDVQPLPEVFLDTCICWNDFPITIEGQTFTDVVAGQIISLEGECGCPFDYNVTIDDDGGPFPITVIEAICPEALIGGYRHPGQSDADASFTMDEIREITLIATAPPILCKGENLVCNERITLDLRVLNVTGGDLSVVIPCDPGSIVLDTSHLEFLPLGDPELEMILEWSGPNGVIPSPSGSITVTEDGIYTVDITIFHALDNEFTECEFSFDYIVTLENCACITQAGVMDLTLIDLCEGDPVTVTATTNPTLETGHELGYILHTNPSNTLGTILDRNDTGMFPYMPTYTLGQTYYISVVGGAVVAGEVDVNDPCFALAPGQPVIWHSTPMPNAGPDDDACNMTYTLAAVPSGGSTGMWAQVDGPGSSLFDMVVSAGATVTVDALGTYQFEWTENNVANNSCMSADTVEITFRGAPDFVGVPIVNCSSDNTTYTVTLNITGGDPSTYMVVDPGGINSGVLTGSMFTSSNILVGQNYNFEVTDAFGCATGSIDDIGDCSCTTDAGEVAQENLDLCSNQTYTVRYNVGEDPNIDSDDILQYLIFDAGGGLLATSDDPVIAFDANIMTLGSTYIIRTIAGNNAGGNVDRGDGCLDQSTSAVSVTWFDEPVYRSRNDIPVCVGDDLIMTYIIDGTGPFTITFDDGTTVYTISNYSSGDDIVVPITGPTTITLTTITSEVGAFCSTSPASSLPIDVELPPVLNVQDSIDVCNKALPGRITSVDFNDWILVGDPGGSWEDIDNSGGIGTLPSLDFTDITPGFYRFGYTTNLSLIACTNVSDTMILEISEDCPCPVIPIGTLPELCNDQTSLTLTPFANGAPGPGDWSIVSTPIGFNPMTISGEELIISGADPGTYEVEFKLRNWPTTCPDSSRQIISLFTVPIPGTANGSVSFCEGEDLPINLFDYLDNEDADGNWTASSAAVTIDAATGELMSTSSIPADDYTLTYTVGPYGVCAADQSTVSLSVVENPIADAGVDRVFTCSDTLFTLGGSNTSVGDDLVYQWFLNDVLLENGVGNTLDVNSIGDYRLEVTNALSNCITDDVVTVTNDENSISGIEVDLRNESCDGDGSGRLTVLNVDGGQEPYTYQLNNEAPVSQPVFEDLLPGDYVLDVTDAVGCPFGYRFTVEEGNALQIDTVPELTVIAGDSININLGVNRNPDDISLVNWANNVALSCDTCLNVTIRPLGTSSFSVNVVDKNGCEQSIQFRIIVTKDHDIYIPNVFRPQLGVLGESKIFRIYGSDKLVGVNKLLIVDRWGNVVYDHANFDPGANFWDGTKSLNGVSTGEILPSAVYVYYVQVLFEDGTTEDFTGDVTLLR